MKTIKRIQNIMVVVGMLTALHIMSREDYASKDFWVGMVILFLVFSIVMYRVAIVEIKRQKEEEV